MAKVGINLKIQIGYDVAKFIHTGTHEFLFQVNFQELKIIECLEIIWQKIDENQTRRSLVMNTLDFKTHGNGDWYQQLWTELWTGSLRHTAHTSWSNHGYVKLPRLAWKYRYSEIETNRNWNGGKIKDQETRLCHLVEAQTTRIMEK